MIKKNILRQLARSYPGLRIARVFYLVLLLIPLSNCGIIQKVMGGKDPPPTPARTGNGAIGSGEDQSDVENGSLGFQWALQAFEAGQYEEAFERFSSIATEGAQVENFELATFYQGRSLYLLNRYAECVPYLEEYLRRNPRSSHAQDARITLLLTRNILRQWRESTILGAETMNSENYFGNKILIELLWAEALIETNEFTGARKLLRDAKQMFDGIPEGSLMGEVLSENKSSLSERAIWLESHLQLRVCENLPFPKQLGSKKAKFKPLLDWFAARGNCLKQAMDVALTSYTVLGPRWHRSLTDSLNAAIESYFDSPHYAASQNSQPAAATVMEIGLPEIRKYFYQMLSSLETSDKNSSIPGTVNRPFHSLSTKIEQGLQRLSISAANSNKSL